MASTRQACSVLSKRGIDGRSISKRTHQNFVVTEEADFQVKKGSASAGKPLLIEDWNYHSLYLLNKMGKRSEGNRCR